jgi:hypothetical protein
MPLLRKIVSNQRLGVSAGRFRGSLSRIDSVLNPKSSIRSDMSKRYRLPSSFQK